MSAPQLDDVTKVVQDAAYVSVGLGVIAFQRAQVRRQELRKRLEALTSQLGDARQGAGSVTDLVDERVKLVEERLAAVEDQVEAAIEQIEARLPEQVAEASRTARAAAKGVRDQVRNQVAQLTS
jgi:uncharacterized protein YicC (UPF0701 family)